MKLITVSILIIYVLIQPVFAGLDYSEKSQHKFRYEVKGEIIVKPDRAIFPIIITVQSKSYKFSLQNANKIVSALKSDTKKLDNEVFSISSSDFFKKHKRRKKINLSFWGDDNKNAAKTKYIAYLIVKFNNTVTFEDRAKYIAESLDFINNFKKKYIKDENTSIYQEGSFYEIDNVEQFREKIVNSVYQKAKLMADIVGKYEGLVPVIKEVYFDQGIIEDIINFNSASLSINAKLEYTFK